MLHNGDGNVLVLIRHYKTTTLAKQFQAANWLYIVATLYAGRAPLNKPEGAYILHKTITWGFNLMQPKPFYCNVMPKGDCDRQISLLVRGMLCYRKVGMWGRWESPLIRNTPKQTNISKEYVSRDRRVNDNEVDNIAFGNISLKHLSTGKHTKQEENNYPTS